MRKKKNLEYNFTYNRTTYTVGLGGLHSVDLPRIVRPNKDEILIDADIGSQYPNAIFKRKLYPKHLGEEWLHGYGDIIQKRISSKKEGKKNVSEAYKLALNGGGYGKLGEEFNWQYSPESMYKCTIGNQIEILMLIEKLETNGIHVVSANTDGILSLFSKSKLENYYKLCKAWELQVGNSVLGNLEYTEYSNFIQTSVNDYLAIKTNGEIKQKGDFVTDFELHKNKSARIIPLALKAYFTDNTDISSFIRNHNSIYDFCLGVKAKGDGKLILFNDKTGDSTDLQKINRYFVSSTGNQMYKKLPELEKSKYIQLDIFGNPSEEIRNISIQAGFKSTVINNVVSPLAKDYDINYQYYINRVQSVIDSIENTNDKK